MPDWTKSMTQSFEYYTVDPNTLADKKRLDNVKSASFSYDSESETLGSATIDIDTPIGEEYVRCYLKTIQNGITEKHVIGTALVQTPSFSFDGRKTTNTVDAYTSLIELKEKRPPLGYAIRKSIKVDDQIIPTYIMEAANRIVRENARAPVNEVAINDESPQLQTNFVANTSDTWLTFTRDLIENANYEFGLEPTGRILFSPKQNIESMQPIWTFNDDNSSILAPSISINQDLYNIPNVVEVTYSYGNACKHAVAENNDPNSPVSIVNRGRKIVYRDTEARLEGYTTQGQLDEYAKLLLKTLSTVKCTLSYTHAYCPVRVGDCVRLNYTRAGLTNIKAKVVSQSIRCVPGCPVTEKAVYTKKLWG